MASLYTVRFNVEETAALDGSTPLVKGTYTVDRRNVLGILDVTIESGQTFGLYDPGELNNSGQLQGFLLMSLTMISQANYAAGSEVAMVSPERPGGGNQEESIVNLISNNGVEPLVGMPIPIDHKLAFRTPGVLGPHLIQLTFACFQSASEWMNIAGTVATPG